MVDKKIEINYKYKQLFNNHNLNTYESFIDFKNGDIVDKNSKRCVYRFVLYDNDLGIDRVFYLKVFHTPSFNNSISSFFSYGVVKSEASIEWDNANLLSESGFNALPVAAYGEAKEFGLEKNSFFVSEEIPDSVTIDEWYKNCACLTEKKSVLLSLGNIVKGLHNAGFFYPDLYVKHIFINTKSLKNNDVVFTFIDLHRLVKKRGLKFNDMVKSLSALIFSSRSIFTDEDTTLWLSQYFQGINQRKKWDTAIHDRLKKLNARRSSRSKGVLARNLINRGGSLYINEEYYKVFERLNVSSFDCLYNLPTENDKITDNPYRRVDTLKIKHDGVDYVFYVKKHFNPDNRKPKKRKNIIEAARLEWKNHLLCEKLGINTAVPIAWGFSDSPLRSLFVTLEIKEAVSLEYILKSGELAGNMILKKVLIEKCAKIASKLHFNGYCHKDFYSGHILVTQSKLSHNNEVSCYLIDLQRITKTKRLKWRWRIKDLAQLNFSSQYPQVASRDRVAFLQYYFGINKLSRFQRFIIKLVESKTKKIYKHIPKVLLRKNIHSWDQVN